MADQGALNREPDAAIHHRLPVMPASVPMPAGKLRLPEATRAREPRAHVSPALQLRDRLLETASLLLAEDSFDARVSLLVLLEMRMKGYRKQAQRAGRE